MPPQPSRRKFIQTSALATAGFWVAGGVAAKADTSANGRVQFGSIGVGGKGSSDSSDAGRFGDLVAICDIDDKTLNNVGRRFKDAEKFYDFRELLDKMGDKIDAVTVSTPDHTHASAAVMAMKMGKHAFVQKPLTHSISEARLLGQLAEEKGLVTQMGNQGTAANGLRNSAAMIKAGVLGTVKEVHVWTNRPVWPQGGDRPTPSEAPSHVHWDEWIGPAPFRPYATGAYHSFKWRGWWDFGTGALGDMACHTVNMPFMALGLRDPLSVQAETSGHNGDSYPKWSKIRFEFAATDDRPALTMYWYDGGMRPSADIAGADIGGSGSCVIGEKGKLISNGDYGKNAELVGVDPIKADFVRSPGHFKEFVQGIQGGATPMSNFPNYASPLSETVLLGNLAVWSAREPGQGPKIEWDAKNMEAKGRPDLASIIKSDYREGYTL